MTAVVGILNKTTVALAADSAATITGPHGDKVYNHANKLFTLSAYQPVGLMIYNSSEWVGLPWETLIKMYRKHLGGQSFATLPEYAAHFIQYLERFKPQVDEVDKIGAIYSHMRSIIELLWDDLNVYTEANEPSLSFEKLNEEERNNYVNDKFLTVIIPNNQQSIAGLPALQGLEHYDLERFLTDYEEKLREPVRGHLNGRFDYSISEPVLDALLAWAHAEMTKLISANPWTGLVISGFGTDELFPQLVSYRVGPLLDNVIRVVNEDHFTISSSNPAKVAPYAQKDDILTFLTGIDPVINSTLTKGAESAFDQFINAIVEQMPPESRADTSDYLSAYKAPVIKDLCASIDQVSRNRNELPILNAIALSSKEELAEMAESLISLTSLKRKFSFAADSVGGPVDVAVITKGEGFIWLKRKQYFKPELNLNYVGSVLNQSPNHSPNHIAPDHEHNAS